MGSCAGECTWREVTGRYQWMDIHEGCLITMQSSVSAEQHKHARARAMRHASCVMRHASCVMRHAQQRPLLHPSSPRTKHHPCCSSTMMIMMILCRTCVCVIITQSTKVCTRLALPSCDVSSSPCLLGLIAAHCSLLILSCPFILSFCSVVKFSMFSLFPLYLFILVFSVFSLFSLILLSLSHCSPLIASQSVLILTIFTPSLSFLLVLSMNKD